MTCLDPGRPIIPAVEAWDEKQLASFFEVNDEQEKEMKDAIEFIQTARDEFALQVPFLRALIVCKHALSEVQGSNELTFNVLLKNLEDMLLRKNRFKTLARLFGGLGVLGIDMQRVEIVEW